MNSNGWHTNGILLEVIRRHPRFDFTCTDGIIMSFSVGNGSSRAYLELARDESICPSVNEKVVFGHFKIRMSL